MNLRRYSISCFLIVLLGNVLSCKKMDHTYRDFVKNGEIIYPGRPEKLQTYSGNNRIDLSMLLTSDPKIIQVKVFWNNGLDSAEKAVQRTSGVDTVRFSLNNIPEGTYTFNVYTYDKNGNRSVKSDIIGNVFGDKYTNSLYNRTLNSIAYIGASKVRLAWVESAEQMIGQEIRYTDSLGVAKSIIELRRLKEDGTPLKDTTILTIFKKGSSFNFRTLFKPEPASLDTFYSGFETRIVL